MNVPAFTDLETRSAGFLTNLSCETQPDSGTILLTARYQSDRFTDPLFDRLDIPCPDTITRAVPKRRADYLAGRAIAQTAMQLLGHPPRPIGTAPNRAPVWPAGLAGSISHARGRCACLVSTNTRQCLGIDTEAIARETSLAALLSETLTSRERTCIASDQNTTARLATLTFSAKETLYKALSPKAGRFFGFDAAELTTLPKDGTLTLTLTEELAPDLPEGKPIPVSYSLSDTHVLTWLIAPSS